MKPIWKSKTIWVNLAVLLGFVLQAVAQQYVVDLEVQMILLSVANILLRLKTTTGVDMGLDSLR